MKKNYRILIYRIGNLGDIICSLPAMMAVRRNFPHAWIGLLTNNGEDGCDDAQAILADNEFLDAIMSYSSGKIRQGRYILHLARDLRRLNIDLLIYFGHSKNTRRRLLRDWLFFRLVVGGKLLGFRLTQPVRMQVKDGLKFPVYPQEVDRLLSLLTPEVKVHEVDFCLPIRDQHRKAVDAIWDRYNL
ncbi:MAG: hypothetical protein WBV23_04145, partial [Desulfobaccales bacterium]